MRIIVHFFACFDHDALSGVLAVSWYPPGTKDDNGEPTEDIVPLILEVAAKYKVKVGVFFRFTLLSVSVISCL